MRPKAHLLTCAVAVVIVIIEAGLADRNDARMIGRIDQPRRVHIGMGVGLVRVDADDLLFNGQDPFRVRSEEHTSELQSLMRISYAVFCLKKKNKHLLPY